MSTESRGWVGGALAAILFACAATACENTAGPTPDPGPGPSGACTATLALNQYTVDLSGKQIGLDVTTGPTCQWTVTTPAWVGVVSKSGGSGTYSNGVGTGT